MMIPCKCGCGELRLSTDVRGRVREYIPGHQNIKPSLRPKSRLCACGCGNQITDRDKKRRLRKYIYGHGSNIIRPHVWIDEAAERTNRGKARKILMELYGYNECEIFNLDCKGRLEAHFLDGDINNIQIDNLVLLCASHNHVLSRHRDILTIEILKTVPLVYTVDKTDPNHRRYNWDHFKLVSNNNGRGGKSGGIINKHNNKKKQSG